MPTQVLFSETDSQRQVEIDRAEPATLVEPVFSWTVQDDPLAGVECAEARKRLQLALAALAIDEPYHQRTISHLQPLLEEAQKLLDTDTVRWSLSQSPADTDGDEPRLNALLALTNQIQWLVAMFRDLPNTWVSIR